MKLEGPNSCSRFRKNECLGNEMEMLNGIPLARNLCAQDTLSMFFTAIPDFIHYNTYVVGEVEAEVPVDTS